MDERGYEKLIVWQKADELVLVVFFIALVNGGLFLCPKPVLAQKKKMEKLEDLSRYYTPKYKDPGVYSQDPTEKKPLYHQGQPQLPEALEDQPKAAQPQWSRPEQLKSPQEFYFPPTDIFLPFTSLEEEKEIEIETREGKLKPEAFTEKLMPIIEKVSGRRPKLTLILEESSVSLVEPVAVVEEEQEEQPEETPKEETKDEWKVLIKKGRVSLKAPTGTSNQDLEVIATYLADLLGRGGEISLLGGVEGIEIKLK
jgi:hypothetical protein